MKEFLRERYDNAIVITIIMKLIIDGIIFIFSDKSESEIYENI